MTNNPWNPASDAVLTQLWTDGISAAQIGVRMNRSKNSIVGRVRRLYLVSRPSPIARTYGPPKPPPARRLPVPKQTLEPLSFVAPAPRLPPQATPRVHTSDLACQFIFNDGAPWQFCGHGVRDGSRVWCAEHYKRVFMHQAPLGPEHWKNQVVSFDEFIKNNPFVAPQFVEALPPV